MEFKEEKYRVRNVQLYKNKIREKGLRYGLGGLGDTAHWKMNIFSVGSTDQQWHTAGGRSAVLLGWRDDYCPVHLFHLLRTDVVSAGKMCLFTSKTRWERCVSSGETFPSAGRENIGHKLQRERLRLDIRESYQNILVCEEIA